MELGAERRNIITNANANAEITNNREEEHKGKTARRGMNTVR